MDYYVGCDMGKHVDYSMITVLARSLAIDPSTGWPARSSLGFSVPAWRIHGLLRPPLRTSYETVAAFVAEVAAMPALKSPVVCLDGTGVGTSTTETVRAATAKLCPDVPVWSVVITSGEGMRISGRHQVNVAKGQLTGALRSALEGGRLRICRKPDGKLPKHGELLLSELRAFKAGTTKAGNTVYAAGGSAHDDAVLSLSIAVFLGSQRWLQMEESGPTLTAAERHALDLESSGEMEPLPGARPVELERAAAIADAAAAEVEKTRFEKLSALLEEERAFMDPFGVRWGA